MKKIIRLTEENLRNIVKEVVSKVLEEQSIDGKYQVYINGEPKNVYINSSEPIIKIDDYDIYGQDALDGVEQIKGFLSYNNCGVESAIEQYLYDMLR